MTTWKRIYHWMDRQMSEFGGRLPPRPLDDAPRTTIAAAAVDAIQIVTGQVGLLPGRHTVAPVTGTPCACFEVTVEQLQAMPGSGVGAAMEAGFAPAHYDWGIEDFLLVDETGVALVKLGLAPDLVLKPHLDASHPARSLPPDLAAYVARVGPRMERPLIHYTRIREHALVPGTRVWVRGMCRRGVDPRVEQGYRGAAQHLIITEPGSDGDQVRITDREPL